MARPPHDPVTALGAAVRARRGEFPASAAAPEIGLTQSTMSAVERGAHRPSYDTAVKLAKWLGWTVEQVMDAAAKPAPEQP